MQITFKVFKERENIKEDKGRSNNLHLLCLALNNLLRDLKEALCNQRQMSADLTLDFPCASAVDRVGVVLLGVVLRGGSLFDAEEKQEKKEGERKESPFTHAGGHAHLSCR